MRAAKKRWLFLPKQVLLILCVLMTVLLLVQVAVFIMYSPTIPHEVTQKKRMRYLEQSPQPSAEPFQSGEDILRVFLRKCTHYQVPLLTADKDILKSSFKGHPTFIVFSELFEATKNLLLEELRAEGFHIVTITGSDPKSTGILLPLHYFLGQDNVTVHLVVFHHQRGKFWWHGELSASATYEVQHVFHGFHLDDVSFSTDQGAYDKFEIRLAEIEGIQFYVPQDIPSFVHQMSTSRFVPCNYSRAEIFRDRYGGSDATAFRDAALEVLLLARYVLDVLTVPFWLSSGTCLGYFRQCGIISHSRDVDIGVWITDYNPRIVERFVANGFKLKHKLGKVEDSLELSFYKSGTKLDVFFFYKDEDYVWNGGLQTKTGRKFKYIFPKFTLCWTEFQDMKVRIPCETQQYIEANYGPNWFVPITQWDWKSSPSNVHEIGQWPTEEWDEVIQEFNVE